jgi:hypothetical protein
MFRTRKKSFEHYLRSPRPPARRLLSSAERRRERERERERERDERRRRK